MLFDPERGTNRSDPLWAWIALAFLIGIALLVI